MKEGSENTEEIYLAGGCLWGVQEFVRHLLGVVHTEAGRANGTSDSTKGDYDGYAECVRTVFDPTQVSVARLVEYLFEIIDPYSVNKQGPDVGEKYRAGIYSKSEKHLQEAKKWIGSRTLSDVRSPTPNEFCSKRPRAWDRLVSQTIMPHTQITPA